jgi:excinuclease UvrABC nuclease subunit
LASAHIPASPGVYAFYRRGKAVYVGKASDLRDRVWKSHNSRSKTLGRSAFRRNVAEQLGIASASQIKRKEHRCSPDELSRVRAWIEQCQVTWIECSTEAAAVDLEDRMKRERMPSLTKV